MYWIVCPKAVGHAVHAIVLRFVRHSLTYIEQLLKKQLLGNYDFA